MASVKNMSAQVDKYIWVLSIICCLNQALWVNGEPIPLVGVETCSARDGCSENCPTNHTCCACARCSDDGFPFARSFCFCCPPDHVCCAQTHRGSNPTCCPSGTMCGESNGVSMCITPWTRETRQADWTKSIPTYCTSVDAETSSTNDEDLTTPSRDVTMETSITEHGSEGTDSTVLGTEKPPVNTEPHASTADRDDPEGTTKRTTTESDNSESLTNLSDSSHVPDITTESEIDLSTANPDVDQSSLNPSVTSELISNSEESHTQTSSDGSATDKHEEKNTTVITEITSGKADEPTSTKEPNSSNTSEAFDTRTVSDKTGTEETVSSVTTATLMENSKTSESMINGTTSGRPE